MKSKNSIIEIIIILISINQIFLLSTEEFNNNNSYEPFKCGVDLFYREDIQLTKTISKQKNINNFQILTSIIESNESKEEKEEEWKSIEIYLDTSEILDQSSKSSTLGRKIDLLIESMQEAVRIIEEIILIHPHKDNYQFSSNDLEKIGIEYYNSLYFGDENKIGMPFDLVIFPKFGNPKDFPSSVLASSSIKFADELTGRPTLGIIEINQSIQTNKENSIEYLKNIFIHEFTHILGFIGYFMNNNFNNTKIFNKIDKNGIKRTFISSPKLLEIAKKYYNCESIEGIELENQEGVDENTIPSHWESRILLGEYMNAYQYYLEYVISEFTLALLEDSGWYKTNYYTGGLMRFGKNKGCDFLENNCVIKGKINNKFKNEFFEEKNNLLPSCSSGRLSRGYSLLYPIKSSYDIPESFQYFSDPEVTGWESADFCPVFTENSKESIYYKFPGHCKFGGGEYGTLVIYNNGLPREEGSEFPESMGEVFGENSFCSLSSLTKEKDEDLIEYKDIVHAVCYPMFCSERSLTVQVNQEYVVCPREGGRIKVLGYNGFLICPDYNLICSGSVLCNNMIDCVDKKSLVKNESYVYDYEINNSQDFSADNESENENEEFFVGYEESDDGICPKDCSQCNIDKECLKYKK